MSVNDKMSQIFDVNGQKIELTTTAEDDFKIVTYRVKSSAIMNPVDVAFILVLIAKAIAKDNDHPFEQLVRGVTHPRGSDDSLH